MTSNNCFIRIFVASADPQFRASALPALRSEPGFLLVGEAADKLAFRDFEDRTQADILLLDAGLTCLAKDAENLWPGVRILLLAAHIDEAQLLEGLRLPIRGIVPKSTSRQTLAESIRSVFAGQYWLSAESIALLIQIVRNLPIEHRLESSQAQHGLTGREGDIVALIAAGRSNREISEQLRISARTVKHHLTSIFEKLGLSSRLQLASFALTHRLATNGLPNGHASAIKSSPAVNGPEWPRELNASGPRARARSAQ